MINQISGKYPNIKARIKALPQNTFAQEVGKDLIMVFGKPVTKILENILNNAVFESTPVDSHTSITIKKLKLQTALMDAKTSLLLAQKEHMEMEMEYQEMLTELSIKKLEKELNKAKKLIAQNEDQTGENSIKRDV